MAEQALEQPTQQELFEEALRQPDTATPAVSPQADEQAVPHLDQPAESKPPPKEPAHEGTSAEAVIPSWRLREEAEARRGAEDRVRQLEEILGRVQTHLKQQEESKKQPDFFEKPDEVIQQHILRVLGPYAEQTNKNLMAMGNMVARATHGAEVVDQAEAAFLAAMNDRSLDPVDYERVVQAPNRYDAVVQWHKRQSVLSSVGDDPNAWFEQQLEQRMNDPQFQAKLLEKVRAGAATRPSATELPPSLSKVTAAAGNRENIGDLSDKSLWAHVLK